MTPEHFLTWLMGAVAMIELKGIVGSSLASELPSEKEWATIKEQMGIAYEDMIVRSIS